MASASTEEARANLKELPCFQTKAFKARPGLTIITVTLLTANYSLLIKLLTVYSSLRTAHCSLNTTHDRLTHYSILTAHYSLNTIHHCWTHPCAPVTL